MGVYVKAPCAVQREKPHLRARCSADMTTAVGVEEAAQGWLNAQRQAVSQTLARVSTLHSLSFELRNKHIPLRRVYITTARSLTEEETRVSIIKPPG